MAMVSVQPLNGFTSSVTVSISGLPSGVTAMPGNSFSVSPGSSQSVTFSAASAVVVGSYSFMLQGSAESVSHSTQVSLQVSALATFSLNPAQVQSVINPGGAASVDFNGALSAGGSNYTLQLSVSGLPSGVTGSFSQNPIPATAASVSLNLSASNNVSLVQNASATVTATSSADGAQSTAMFLLIVSPPPGQLSNNRSNFVRTDGLMRDGAFDPVHHLLFVSNASWNRVDVISTTSNTLVRSIPVPDPWGMDLSLNGSTVLVGTATLQIFTLDTGNLEVVGRTLLQDLLPSFLNPTTSFPRQMANGKVLILAKDNGSTASALLKWSPATNAVSLVTLPPTFQPAAIARSADGSKAVVVSNTLPNAAMIYDSATDSFTTSQNLANVTFPITVSPDGSRFAAVNGNNGFMEYDSSGNSIGAIPCGPVCGPLTGMNYSPDGSKLYLVIDSGTPNVVTLDASTLTALGAAPAVVVGSPYTQGSPVFTVGVPFATDSTGLIFETSDHGVVIDDSTFFQSLTAQVSTPSQDRYLTPGYGPANATTTVQFETQPFALLPDVWFGQQRGTGAMLDGSGLLHVVAPLSSSSGPVNVKAIDPGGIQVFDPLAFSYGPQILYLSGTAGSPSGGEAIDLFTVGVPASTSQVQVTVGGNSANVVSAQGVDVGPFPVVDVKATVPPGISGPADVAVITAAGSFVLKSAFHYATNVTDHATTDMPQSVLFDRFRDQVYLSAGDHVDVFSLQTNSFIAPLNLPGLNGPPYFGGLALTVDGSKLLVGNLHDGSVVLVDPSNPSSPTVVAVSPPQNGNCMVGPAYIAATSTNKALIITGAAPTPTCGSGNGSLYQLGLSTLLVTQLTAPLACPLAYLSSTRDGSKVAISGPESGIEGFCLYDPSSSIFTPSQFSFGTGAAASGDGNVFAGMWRLTDAKANVLNLVAFPDPLYSLNQSIFANMAALQEEKLNDSGSLLYAPFQQTVDVFDTQHGMPVLRIALEEQIQNVLDAMSINLAGDQLYLITSAGLTIVQLDTAPVAIGSVTPGSSPPGTQVVLRGSGFTQSSTVSIGGTSAAVTFVDSSTLDVTIPSVPPGPAQVKVVGAASESYSLDNAFSVQ